VLTTNRKDGSVLVSPVWFRWNDGAFEMVIAEGDVKLAHLRRDRCCVLVVCEATRPFRRVEVRAACELVEGDATAARRAIASHYLGAHDGERSVAGRRSKPGVLRSSTLEAPPRAEPCDSCRSLRMDSAPPSGVRDDLGFGASARRRSLELA
jgi:hypothetical protein